MSHYTRRRSGKQSRSRKQSRTRSRSRKYVHRRRQGGMVLLGI
jgi:hypothetical protein